MSEIQGVSPSDTDPTDAIPLPLPSPTPPNIPSIQTLQSWLPLYVKRADRTIEHLNRVLSTPAGTDTFLLAIGYSSLAASTILSSISIHHLRLAARKLISAATTLPANTTVLIDATSLPTPRLLRTAQSLKALSSLIGDFRIFARLWGLLGIWSWGKGLLQDPPTDIVVKRIVWAEIVVNVLYQYLENAAYLASKGVLGLTAEKQTKYWLWSSRFWAAHVGLEFWRLGHERRVREARKARAGKIGGKGAEVDGSKGAKEENYAVEERAWTRQVIVNMAYAPLTIHWSLENGLCGDLWVGALGSVAGALKMTDLWKRTS